MQFDQAFIDVLKEDPIAGVINVCQAARNALDPNRQAWDVDEYEMLMDSYALIDSLIETGLIEFKIVPPLISGDLNSDCGALMKYFEKLVDSLVAQGSKRRLERLKAQYKMSLGRGIIYEFSSGDLERVQLLINQLRVLIAESSHWETDHRDRLLKRLEKLQSEMHKRVSDLDKFWGLIGDAGVVLGKFGTDAKPIIDRIKEIADIVWQTQSRAEKLPSGTPIPLLENKIE